MATTPNPNWPLIEESWGPYWGAKGGTLSANRWVETTARVIGTTAVQRGRQYELDQVRAGEYRLTLDNTDGAFDPTNASSPWTGKVVPFQPVRKRAQYPRTVNLLNQTQATGGDVGGQPLGTLNSFAAQVFSDTDSSGGSIVTSGTAFRGSRVLQFAVPNATASGQRILQTSEPSVEPGTTYTVQIRVRNITPSTTLQVKAHVGWYLTPQPALATYTYGTTQTLTGSATAAWTQLTLTVTAPAGALGMNVGVTVAATAGATCSVQTDEWQLEKAASATTWVQPGVWYPIYKGFAERFPQTWTDPKFASVQVTAVDTFALLSQITLLDPFDQEVFSRSPRFMYAFADPQNSTAFADSAGLNPPAPLAVSKYGAGSVTAGTQITSASPGGAYTGSTGTVLNIANPSPGTGTINPATFVSLGGAGITGPATPSGTWTRMIAFRYTAGTPAAAAYMWTCFDSKRASDQPSGSRLNCYITSAGRFEVSLSGPSGSVLAYPAPPTVADGNWHLAIITYGHSTADLLVFVDGSYTYYTGVPSTQEPTGLVSDNIGSYVDPGAGNGTAFNWQGDIAFATEWPAYFFLSDMQAIYAAWRTSCAGDSTDTRYRRILGWAGYTGDISTQAGLTTAMGPASGGTDAVSALQDVVTTEGGAHYVDRSGVITFKARSDRYNQLTSTYTFGDGPGEYPYEPGVSFDYDPTRLANIVQATQTTTGQVFTAKDQASIDQYFPRNMPRSLNTQSALEVQDAANYLLSRYRQPALRVSAITLNPGANPALWPVCLSLELGMRVTVNRRTAAGNTISQPCFVENVQPNIGPDTATWTLQLSPVDTTPYGILAAFHTTLNASVGSGVTSVVIKNATGQNNTDPAAAQIPTGKQFVLGLGTANQETVTVLSVGTTTSGWTTCTLTLTAATTKAHTAGDIVCEALPAGVTDATTWDNVSKYDQHAYAY